MLSIQTGISQWHKPDESYLPFEEDDQEVREEQEDDSLLEADQEEGRGKIKNSEKGRSKLDVIEDSATSPAASRPPASIDGSEPMEKGPTIKKQASFSQMIAKRFGLKKEEKTDENLSRPSQEQQGTSRLKKPPSFSLLPTRNTRSQSDQKPTRSLRSIFFRSSSHG